MKRRFLVLVQLLFVLSLFILACSKDQTLRMTGVKSELEIGSLRPDPMPPDSLLLDSLNSPPYQ